MRRILALAVVLLIGTALIAVAVDRPAEAVKPVTPARPQRITIPLYAEVSSAQNGPKVSEPYVVPAGQRLVIESVSRWLRVPGYADLVNQLVVAPATADNPPAFEAIDRTYPVNVWSGNPVYNIANLNNGISPAPCPDMAPYKITGDTNSFTAVVEGGEELGISMFLFGTPGSAEQAWCLAIAEYTVTGVLEPAGS